MIAPFDKSWIIHLTLFINYGILCIVKIKGITMGKTVRPKNDVECAMYLEEPEYVDNEINCSECRDRHICMWEV